MELKSSNGETKKRKRDEYETQESLFHRIEGGEGTLLEEFLEQVQDYGHLSREVLMSDADYTLFLGEFPQRCAMRGCLITGETLPGSVYSGKHHICTHCYFKDADVKSHAIWTTGALWNSFVGGMKQKIIENKNVGLEKARELAVKYWVAVDERVFKQAVETGNVEGYTWEDMTGNYWKLQNYNYEAFEKEKEEILKFVDDMTLVPKPARSSK